MQWLEEKHEFYIYGLVDINLQTIILNSYNVEALRAEKVYLPEI